MKLERSFIGGKTMSSLNYRLNDTDLKHIDARLLYITESSFGADWLSIPHTHHFVELFFITKGNGKFMIENELYTIKKNDLIVINPNVLHTEYAEEGSKDSFEYVVLGVNGLKFLDMSLNQTFLIYDFSNQRQLILNYLNLLLEEIKLKKENFTLICQNLLEALLLIIARGTKADLKIEPSKKITQECRFIEQYISTHYKEEITLDELADLTYLNKYYLIHSFKEFTGYSPINYLINVRINEAKHLLSTTDYPISKVAMQVGFSSHSYFCQIFKKETGQSPLQYRKSS